MPHVADDADDFVRPLAQRTEAETLPQRVFARKESLRKHLTDEDDFRIVAHFPRSEAAPFQKRDAHGAKIIVVDVANISVRALPGIRGRAPLNVEVKVSGLAG